MNVRFIIGAVFWAFLQVGGCSTHVLTPGPSYPGYASRQGALDMQIQLHGRLLTLTNTTASPFSAGRLWVNGWYSAPTPDLAVGQTIQFPLAQFHDEHGEIIRGGGFLASEAPEEILLAELETNGALHGLIVVRQ